MKYGELILTDSPSPSDLIGFWVNLTWSDSGSAPIIDLFHSGKITPSISRASVIRRSGGKLRIKLNTFTQIFIAATSFKFLSSDYTRNWAGNPKLSTNDKQRTLLELEGPREALKKRQ